MPPVRPARATLTACALAAALLILAGCSSGATPASPDESGAAPDSGALPTSPLDAFFGGSGGSIATESARRRDVLVEEAIARCMNAQGFEYEPVDRAATEAQAVRAVEDDPEQFAADFGYGITVPVTGAQDEDVDDAQDPNAAYLAGMSSAERNEYERTLYGDVDPESAAPAQETDPAATGCHGAALREVAAQQESAVVDGRDIAAVAEATARLQDAVDHDRRVVAATRDWAACMDAAGLPYADFDDVEQHFLAEAAATATAPRSRVLEIQDDERRTATADLACVREVGYDRALATVREELESDFIEQHREELEAAREALEAVYGSR